MAVGLAFGLEGFPPDRRHGQRLIAQRNDRNQLGRSVRPLRPGLPQAPRILPLLHSMDERAGKRRRIFVGCPSPQSSPHSFLAGRGGRDRKSTPLNSSHTMISYAVFCLEKKKKRSRRTIVRQCEYTFLI